MLRTMYMQYDRNAVNDGAKLFMNVVSTVGRFIQRMFDWDNTVVVSAAKASSKPVYESLGAFFCLCYIHANVVGWTRYHKRRPR